MTAELPPLREVIARHGLSASKALGQNFLLDRQLLDRIAAIPGPLEGQQVYEVGPGPGGLTAALLSAGASVTSVEMDRRCLPALAELQQAFPGRLRLIQGDAMKIDEQAQVGAGAHVVANLPYNVGTALLLRWLETDWPPWWRSLTLMFQREVAERIVAKPGDETYGRLAVAAQWRSVSRIAMHVRPGEAPAGVEPTVLSRLTAAAFGQRRKMLRSSLKGVAGALEAIAELGIDGHRRAETVSVAEWVELARRLSA